MPYANEITGVYFVVNNKTKESYVGQSRRMKKRVAEHFRLLRLGTHPNKRMQASFDMHGGDVFTYVFEVVCEDVSELDCIEEAFLRGDASFDAAPNLFNISNSAQTPMQGRKHTNETKNKVSISKKGRTEHVTTEYKAKLKEASLRRRLSDPKWVSDTKFLLDNPDMSYAERGRVIGLDTSSTRKRVLKYQHLRGKL